MIRNRHDLGSQRGGFSFLVQNLKFLEHVLNNSLKKLSEWIMISLYHPGFVFHQHSYGQSADGRPSGLYQVLRIILLSLNYLNTPSLL